MPAIPVRCIFHGGGAKLATLLAAAQVLEKLETDKRITITHVAGTSAGSIAAYCLASQTPVSEFRGRIALAAQRRIKQFEKMPGRLRIGLMAGFGRPILGEDLLRNFIREVLSKGTGEPAKLGNLRVPIYIRAVDARTSANITYSGTDVLAENALVDSCSIPFVFKTYSRGSWVVDGGLTSNLLDDSVFPEPEGNTIAFSFKKIEFSYETNLLAYCQALMNATMDNSVREAATRVANAGGFRCDLPNDFKTFDFRDAMERGLTDNYFEGVKGSISADLNDALTYFDRRKRKKKVTEKYKDLVKFTGTFGSRINAIFPTRVASATMLCVANGLHDHGDQRRMLRDELVKIVTFEAAGDYVLSLQVGITRNEAADLGDEIEWKISDCNGDALEAEQQIIEVETKDGISWFTYFLLKDPLPSARTPVTVQQHTYHFNLMGGLEDGRVEWMRTRSKQPDEIKYQDIVIVAPRNFGKLVLSELADNVHRLDPQPDNLSEMTKNYGRGRVMNGEEVKRYDDFRLNHQGTEIYGWRVDKLQAEAYCGVLIERSQPLNSHAETSR